VAANLAMGLISAALAGALFLVVILLINGWGASPLSAAAAASALPAGTVIGEILTARQSARRASVAGCLTVAAGLATLALLPDRGWTYATVGLAAIGLGLGLAMTPIAGASIRLGASFPRDGALSIAVRHAGLVFALAAVTPVLTADLNAQARKAFLVGSDSLLSAPISLNQKVKLAQAAASTVTSTPAGQLPDLTPAFREAAPDGKLDGLRRDLDRTITSAVTGGFRRAFGLCALLALVALAPAAALAPARGAGEAHSGRAPPRRWALALVPVLAAALALATLTGADRSQRRLADPCREQPAFARGGVDGITQQIALDALDGAACKLGTSRVALLLTLLPDKGQPRVTVPSGQLTPAVRAGLNRALDRQVDEGRVPGFLKTPLRFAFRFTPVDWLVRILQPS
jgi:hypothetical protein